MDKQDRLTRWDEWEVGAHYEHVKGRNACGDSVLVEVNEKEGYVKLKGGGEEKGALDFNWRNRYRLIPTNKAKEPTEADRRNAWAEAQTERSKTLKVLQWKRQDYINAKNDHDCACEREEYLYKQYMKQPPSRVRES